MPGGSSCSAKLYKERLPSTNKRKRQYCSCLPQLGFLE